MLNNLTIGNKIGASVGFGLTILAAIGVLSYQATKNLIETSGWQTHTYQVLEQLNNLKSQLKDAERAQRIYLLTGEKRELQIYNTVIPVIEQSVKSLKKLTADNLNQQRRIDVLEPELQKKIATMQSSISLRDSQGLNAVRQQELTENSNNSAKEIRRIMLYMESEERNLLEKRSQQTQSATREAINTITYSVPLAFVLLTLIGIYLTRNISKPLGELSQVTKKLAMGDLSVSTTANNRQDEIGVLSQAFNEMVANLRQTTKTNNEQNWLKSNVAKFSQMLQNHRSLETVPSMILSELAPLVNAQQGVFYIMDCVDEQPMLRLIGSYAYQQRKYLSNRFHLGEGLVGQCALEKQKIILTDVPTDYIHISSGLGEAKPLNIIVLPVLFENQVTAVIELASFQRFGEISLIFLEQVTETIGVVLNIIAADIRTQELLQESQNLTQQLQIQQQELQHSNQILEEQAQTLQASEELLKQQQQELQQSNEELQQLNAELEGKAELLSVQKKEVEHKNQQLDETRKSLEEKAEQLALSSKYKSEFLANMSHELRTPLNSLLILAKLLADNVEGNLTAKQVEYSRTILERDARTPQLPTPLIDDRANIQQGDRVLLIVEDDLMFARILLDMARQKEFKVIVAHNGSTGLRLVQEFQPSAIILDIRLPEMDGWTVLDRLKHNPSTRHIPVHIMTVEEGRQRGLQQGAIAYLQKPVSSETLQQVLTEIRGSVDRSVKNLLIVEDDSTQRQSLVELMSNIGVETSAVGTGTEALAAIRSQHYDCVILDLGLPDMSGFEVISQIKQQPDREALPIIVYTARELTRTEDTQLRRIAETIIVKDVGSSKRLLDETALFLHRVQVNLPTPKRQILEQLPSSDSQLVGKKVLIVDDDMRNIFALTSMLERYQIQVLYAENGKEGIEVVQNNPDVDMVLMDMMMPELDGYQTTRLIRQNNQFKSLPIIALTAKAMQSDRDKCIEAGASDYISKPVDTEQLLSLLRVWLYR